MRHAFACFGSFLLASFGAAVAQQEAAQEKPKETPAAADTAKPAGAERKNPVKPTPEGMAGAKKMYGYDCAMCHGAHGDGKGDLVASMSLTMKDWREPASLSNISDGEIYDIIVKGKGKMVGEGDRLPAEKVWHLINYVRSFAKKDSAEKPPDAEPKP